MSSSSSISTSSESESDSYSDEDDMEETTKQLIQLSLSKISNVNVFDLIVNEDLNGIDDALTNNSTYLCDITTKSLIRGINSDNWVVYDHVVEKHNGKESEEFLWEHGILYLDFSVLCHCRDTYNVPLKFRKALRNVLLEAHNSNILISCSEEWEAIYNS